MKRILTMVRKRQVKSQATKPTPSMIQTPTTKRKAQA
jgi:hypothetical protein